MLIRRAQQAGHAGVTLHQYRRTLSDASLKSAVPRGDLMRLNGWKSRAMVDRCADYVADNQLALGMPSMSGSADRPSPVSRFWRLRSTAGHLPRIHATA